MLNLKVGDHTVILRYSYASIYGARIDFDPVIMMDIHSSYIYVLEDDCEREIPVHAGSSFFDELSCTFWRTVPKRAFPYIKCKYHEN